MARRDSIHAHFRLNLDQQRKRAKELLRAAKASDGEALARFRAAHAASLKLADAQFVIAKEFGFANWSALKAHIESMERERTLTTETRRSMDAELRTLHVRCGSDIRQTLADAGFVGDFLEHSNPYCVGPVTDGPDRLEKRARFLAAAFGESLDLDYTRMLEGLREDERRLARSITDYERVVLWMEHDSYDQLVLLRCLAFYAAHSTPPRLELISVDRFPGSTRFIGLGQLPAEALRLIWARREPVSPMQLRLAADAWRAFVADDPAPLALLMRSGTPPLPHLAPALRRHLQELPSTVNGLSLTEQLVLQILTQGPSTLNEMWQRLLGGLEPLPWLGDTMFLDIVDGMERVHEPPFVRKPSPDGQRFKDEYAITDVGRAVIGGKRDWLTLHPPVRWVGGVRIDASQPAWRWDDRASNAERDGAQS